jgi:hypothetical protein
VRGAVDEAGIAICALDRREPMSSDAEVAQVLTGRRPGPLRAGRVVALFSSSRDARRSGQISVLVVGTRELCERFVEVAVKSIERCLGECAELLVAPRTPAVPQGGGEWIGRHPVSVLAFRTSPSEDDPETKCLRARRIELCAPALSTRHKRLRRCRIVGAVSVPTWLIVLAVLHVSIAFRSNSLWWTAEASASMTG